jgi:hypothetical protein
MPKNLDQPIVVVAEQKADRLLLTSYTVNVQAFTAMAQLMASRANVDDPTNEDARINFAFPDKPLDRPATERIAAMAGLFTVVAALRSIGVDEQLVAEYRAALEANPAATLAAYYGGTRDAFYANL